MTSDPAPQDKARDDDALAKWLWMMEWCKKEGLPPDHDYVWMWAEKAWDSIPVGENRG